MVVVDWGDGAQPGMVDDIGGVKQAPEPGLQKQEIGRHF